VVVTTPPPPVAKTLEEANSIIAMLWAELHALREEVAVLKARLSQNSTNSSRPPSTDAPWSKPKRKPPQGPSGRNPGGQPGHPAHVREPVPPEDVDETLDVHPDRCGICGTALPPDLPGEDAYEHQVTELAEARAVVKAYRLWRKRCPNCGGRTRARRPADVPEDAFGPRLKAVVTTLSAKYRVSRREMVEALRDLFGVGISVGSVQAICERVSKAVAPAVETVRREVATSPAVHADETGWRQKREMHWLWTATTPRAAYFVLADNRGRAALSLLLPDDYAGVVHCDRWRPYERFGDARQLCHAHLRRDFQAAIDRGGVAKPIGKRLLALSDRLFNVWHSHQRGDIDRMHMARAMEPVEDAWEEAVGAAYENGDDKLHALARDLFKQWNALWTFVHVEGVEPTNNDAEQSLRPAVLWRKGSFGTRSDAGSAFVARMRTVIETARRRGVRPVEWIEQTCRAATLGLEPPPLLAG
jgi:transposase